MSRIAFILLILIILSGCTITPKTAPLHSHKCDDDDIVRVKQEFEMCLRTSYDTSYCFYQAKKSQCPVANPGEFQ